MPDGEVEEKTSDFYDVEKVKRLFDAQSNIPPPGFVRHTINRASKTVDSVSGFFSVILRIPLIFGGFFAVVVGMLYGPFAFLAVVGSVFGSLAFYLNRRIGKTIQFGDSSISMAVLAQVIGLSMAAGFLILLLFLPRLL